MSCIFVRSETFETTLVRIRSRQFCCKNSIPRTPLLLGLSPKHILPLSLKRFQVRFNAPYNQPLLHSTPAFFRLNRFAAFLRNIFQ